METLMMDITATMGVSAGTANKVIDLAMMGASGWAIATTVLAGGGIIAIGGAALAWLVRDRVKKYGVSAAIAW